MKKLSIAFSAAAVLALGGCKKFIDINNNPNNATTTRADYVFSGALGTSYRNQVSNNLMITPGTWVGYYAHSTSFTGGGNEKTYDFTLADFNAFDALFDNLQDYEYVKQNADRDVVSLWKNPADVMQCYVYQMLVDLYGNVPYKQALKGTQYVTPTYDDAKAIYEDLVVRLDTAMARMSRETWPTTTDITRQDVYFQGNRTNWIRFANTVKLRILMRQSFMPGRDAYIANNINSTLSNGYITANVLVQPGYQNISGKLNPFFANYGYNELNNVTSNYQYRKMNAVIINWLKTGVTTTSTPPSTAPAPTANADTFRLQALAYPAGTTPSTSNPDLSTYLGIPLGVGSGYPTAGASPIGPFQIVSGQGTRPGMMVLLAEAYFLQAEAAQRYGIAFSGGTAQQLYEAGILSHFRTCASAIANLSPTGTASNAGDAFALRYIARDVNNQGWAASTDKIKAILVQKWVSLCHINGLEAWSDYRKSTVSPQSSVPISPKTTASTANPEPVRYLYPQAEVDANTNNVPKNTSRFASKIFWDVN